MLLGTHGISETNKQNTKLLSLMWAHFKPSLAAIKLNVKSHS